jgi:hypothetical protein
MMLLFNSWRLNAIHASYDSVLSERCDTRKKFLAARTYHGRTFVAFLKTIYDSLEMPNLLAGGTATVADLLSPIRPKHSCRKVTYEMWSQEEEWVKFRTTPHPCHVPSNISILVRQLFLPSSAGKRKRQETVGGSNVDGEHDIGQGGDEMDSTLASHGIVDEVGGEEIVEISGATQATTSCRSPDHRRWCIRCTYKIRIRSDDGKDKPKNVSRFEGLKPKKTNFYCRRCEVSLCEACFRPWHDEKDLPPTPLQA